MAIPTPVNGQITDAVQQHKIKAQEALGFLQAQDYENAIKALQDMIDPEFGLKPTRK